MPTDSKMGGGIDEECLIRGPGGGDVQPTVGHQLCSNILFNPHPERGFGNDRVKSDVGVRIMRQRIRGGKGGVGTGEVSMELGDDGWRWVNVSAYKSEPADLGV